MQYEIRVWNNPEKMPDMEPHQAAGRLKQMYDKTVDKLSDMAANATGTVSLNAANPDILIDKNGGGDDVIQAVDISYIMKTIKVTLPENLPLPNQVGHAQAPRTVDKDVRVIKMNIKGNLYLPLKQDGLVEEVAASFIGGKKDENKIRDTLLLSQWASVRPERDKEDHFYRGVVVSILTKAGDFRIITAKKVYVESYTENYQEGEFGTFSLSLVESVDANDIFKVAGLGYEEIPLIKSLADKVEKAAKVTAAVGTAVATAGVVGKTITETVEKFTGETAATRWVKYGMDTASNAGNIANSASNVMKNPKDVKTWTDETKNVTKNVTDNIKDAKDKSHKIIPIADLEASYLAIIKKDPKLYEEYLNMSDEDKRAELMKAAEKSKDRAQITKDSEQAIIDNTKKNEVENLEKEYLDLIKADPELSEKYNKATIDDKLKMLQEQKKNFDDLQDKYLPVLKEKCPEKYAEYSQASTDKQLEMLQQAKNLDELQKEYLDVIKADPEKLKEYDKASTDKKLEMLLEIKKKAEAEKQNGDSNGTN